MVKFSRSEFEATLEKGEQIKIIIDGAYGARDIHIRGIE
jgi:hypothetical protein